MKKLLLSLMCMLGIAIGMSASTTYTLITSMSDINTTDKYIIASSKTAGDVYVMKGTAKTNGVKVSMANNQITIDTEAVFEFKFEADGSNYKLKQASGSQYLTIGTSSQSVGLGTSATTIALTVESDGAFKVKNSANNGRWIMYRPTSTDFRTYNSNQSDCNLVYIYKEANVATAPAAPVISFAYETNTVTITAEEGASIKYSLGQNVTPNIDYEVPFAITKSTLVNAIAEKNGLSSDVATKYCDYTPTTGLGEFTSTPAAVDGVISVKTGKSVTFTAAGAEEIMYSISECSAAAQAEAVVIEGYTYTFTPTENCKVELVASLGDQTVDAVYTIVVLPLETCGTVTFTPAGGEVEMGSTVTLSCENAAKIVYTVNGGEAVTVDGATATVTINEACTISAHGVSVDDVEGDPATASYTVVVPQYIETVFPSTTDETKDTWNKVFRTNLNGSISGLQQNQAWSVTGSIDGVTLKIDKGTKTASVYVKDNEVRMYDGYTATVTAPAGALIKKITTTKGDKTLPTTGASSNVGSTSVSSGAITWNGSANQVVFSISGTGSMTTMTVRWEYEHVNEITTAPTMRLNGSALTIACQDATSIVYSVAYSDASNTDITNVEAEGSSTTITLAGACTVTAYGKNSAGNGPELTRSFKAATVQGTAWAHVTAQTDVEVGGEYIIVTYPVPMSNGNKRENDANVYVAMGAFNNNGYFDKAKTTALSSDNQTVESVSGDVTIVKIVATETEDGTKYSLQTADGKYISDASGNSSFALVDEPGESTYIEITVNNNGTTTLDFEINSDKQLLMQGGTTNKGNRTATQIFKSYSSTNADNAKDYCPVALYKKTTVMVEGFAPEITMPTAMVDLGEGQVVDLTTEPTLTAGAVITFTAPEGHHMHIRRMAAPAPGAETPMYRAAGASAQDETVEHTDKTEFTADDLATEGTWYHSQNSSISYELLADDLENGLTLEVRAHDPATLTNSDKHIFSIASDGTTTGVESVEVENAPVEYYNLQGVRVSNPQGGIFIRRQGGKTMKVAM